MNNTVHQRGDYSTYPISLRMYPQSILRISKKTMSILEYPKKVRILISSDNKEIAIQPCDENDKEGLKIKAPSLDRYCGYMVCSKLLLVKIFEINKWDKKLTYKIEGTYIKEKNMANSTYSNYIWTYKWGFKLFCN